MEAAHTTTAVLDQLNAYQGDNIWEDVIYTLDYDEAATDGLDSGDDTRFVAAGVEYYYDQQAANWEVAR